MAHDGWLDIADAPAGMEDDRMILVWHAYQGVLVVPFFRLRKNRFNLLWQELPETWIETEQRQPTRADADVQGAVIARNIYGEVRTLGWQQVKPESIERQWAPPPPPPPNHAELRQQTD